MAARRVGTEGQVYAFEPVPRNAAAIRRTAQLNGFHAIRVFPEAVGATIGRAELLLARHIGGGRTRLGRSTTRYERLSRSRCDNT
ncbi:hypothetical protein [Sinorhizobium meliloti]